MFVNGVGRTKFGRLKETLPQLMLEATKNALHDAELSLNDLQAIYVSNFNAGYFQKQLHLNSLFASLYPGLNLPAFRIEAACASGGAALYQALLALNKFDNVLVLGVEKMTDVPTGNAIEALAMAGDRTDQQQGLIFPAAYALLAAEHMKKYGTTLEDLGKIAVQNHDNANLNELAQFYGKKITTEAVQNSPVVCTPLRLLDCSPVSDGAAALVVSKKKTGKSIKVLASACATDTLSLAQRSDLTTLPAARKASEIALKEANLKAREIGMFEVHDCFTINQLIAMEDIGLCKPGDAAEMISQGKTTLKGEYPVNTDGGLKANGHPIGATGVAQVYEAVTQLRGEAGKRQVKAQTALTHNVGGVGGTAVVHIFGV